MIFLILMALIALIIIKLQWFSKTDSVQANIDQMKHDSYLSYSMDQPVDTTTIEKPYNSDLDEHDDNDYFGNWQGK